MTGEDDDDDDGHEHVVVVASETSDVGDGHDVDDEHERDEHGGGDVGGVHGHVPVLVQRRQQPQRHGERAWLLELVAAVDVAGVVVVVVVLLLPLPLVSVVLLALLLFVVLVVLHLFGVGVPRVAVAVVAVVGDGAFELAPLHLPLVEDDDGDCVIPLLALLSGSHEVLIMLPMVVKWECDIVDGQKAKERERIVSFHLREIQERRMS